ncbi:MAG: glycosyltransferase family 4 protein [Rhodospirillales bacterium]|nr:glycosyltransferase family 4 protein [Rhodospirillales bacterium]
MTDTQQQHRPVIMQVIPELGPGGAEQGCIDIAAALHQAGALPLVVSHGGARLHELARVGGVHIDLPVHSKNPLVMARNIFRLKKIIKKYNVDIVHARSRAPAWSCYYACKNTRADFMTTCHAPYNISGDTKRLYNEIIAKGERVIAISGYVADYLKRHYRIDPDHIRVVHRGIALDKFHPTAVTPERMITLSRQWRVPDGASIVMLPGRLTRWKGHHVLIEAIDMLNRKDVFCVIIGSDQGRTGYRQELEEAIQERGLGGQVRMIDHCNDMPAAYMLATIVVSASTDPEGFGRVPVEGQAMGRPVIATDHGGAQETIVRGETGWLVRPGDARSLSQAINEALSLNPTQRAVLATRAMAHIARNFTREKMADETLNVYAELLERKMKNRPESLKKDRAMQGPSLGMKDAAE